jgi:hypothetical protein
MKSILKVMPSAVDAGLERKHLQVLHSRQFRWHSRVLDRWALRGRPHHPAWRDRVRYARQEPDHNGSRPEQRPRTERPA